ncbi:MAG: OmpA family protein [Alphaproteobacteria bacterium]
MPSTPKPPSLSASSVPPPPPSLQKPATSPQIASRTPPTETTEDGTISIGFEEDVSDLPASATGPLDALIERMNQDSNIRVRLNGYASSTGDSPSQARRISLFRALSVRTYMMKNGIRSTRIDIHALGSKGDQGEQNKVDVIVRSS